MRVTPFDEAVAYHPAGHVDMRCYRLLDAEDGEQGAMQLKLCQFLPGGSTGAAASPFEKFYVVLEGELVVSNHDRETVLRAWDSCRIAPGETRLIENRSRRPSTILLTMADFSASVPQGAERACGGSA